ncbi:unnamed protein product, partial [Prunus brigantina]
LWIQRSADDASKQENGSGSSIFFDIGGAPLEFANFAFVALYLLLLLLLLVMILLLLFLLLLPSLHCLFHFRHHLDLGLLQNSN